MKRDIKIMLGKDLTEAIRVKKLYKEAIQKENNWSNFIKDFFTPPKYKIMSYDENRISDQIDAGIHAMNNLRQFKISRISSDGVWGKEVNPYGEKPNKIEIASNKYFSEKYNLWQASEAQLQEYPLTEEVIDIKKKVYLKNLTPYQEQVYGNIAIVSPEGYLDDFAVYVLRQSDDTIVGQDYWGFKDVTNFQIGQLIPGEVVDGKIVIKL